MGDSMREEPITENKYPHINHEPASIGNSVRVSIPYVFKGNVFSLPFLPKKGGFIWPAIGKPDGQRNMLRWPFCRKPGIIRRKYPGETGGLTSLHGRMANPCASWFDQPNDIQYRASQSNWRWWLIWSGHESSPVRFSSGSIADPGGRCIKFNLVEQLR